MAYDFVQAHLEHMRDAPTHPVLDEWAALFTVAAACGGRVWFDEKVFSYRANMYTIFVGEPGSAKSLAITECAKYLRQIPSIHLGADMITVPALVQKLQEIQFMEPIIPLDSIKTDKGFVSWTDRLQQKSMQMSNLSIVADELGTFIDMREPMIFPLMIKMWDGHLIDKQTKTGTSERITNAWVNFIGAVTPSWIRRTLTPDNMEDGWASRTIFVCIPGYRVKTKAHYDDVLTDDYRREIKELTEELRWLHRNLRGPMSIEPPAREVTTEYKAYIDRQAEEAPNAQRLGYYTRKYTNFRKMMMAYALGRRSLAMSKRDAERARDLLESTEPDMGLVFQAARASPGVKAADTVLRTVDSLINGTNPPTVLKDRVYRMLLSDGMSYTDFQHALATLVAAGEIQHRGVSLLRTKSDQPND